jgi:AcrR family transcriptional regulator
MKVDIYKAAITAFAQLGYQKCSLTYLARKIGKSKALLLHHFTSKQALYDETYAFASSQITPLKTTFDQSNLPFFDKISLIQQKKLLLEHTYPGIFTFLLHAQNHEPKLWDVELTDADHSMFRHDTHPQMVILLLNTLALGSAELMKYGMSYKTIETQFQSFITWIKKHAFKEDQ